MAQHPTTEVHEALKKSIMECFEPYKDKISAIEILAVLSNTVGQCLAMQDQTKLTPEMALQIVSANIEQGNQYAVAQLMATQGEA